MKTSRIIMAVVAITVVVILFYSMSTGTIERGYSELLEQERQQKHDFMRSDPGSPFAKDTAAFHELKYFAPDPRYKVVADLEEVQDRKIVVLGTNDGLEQRYLEYAYATFRLNGADNRLLILEVIESGPFRGTLFLAFADQTSAFETYGAGRYLDVVKTPGATTITLDFNQAYNPYCAYSDEFSCPLPPKENVLTIAVKAGEMTYERPPDAEAKEAAAPEPDKK
jgi:uncharacterized protein (DUF1684 family)